MKRKPFWDRLSKAPSGCWVWTGARQVSGYGVLTTHGRVWPAHRMAWHLANGPIPDGLWVLHRCDNRPCVNPAHLFLGTPRDNVRDMWAKGRNRPLYGEYNQIAKLTDAAVRAIRAEVRDGATQASVAAKHGVSYQTIFRVVNRRSWVHVAD